MVQLKAFLLTVCWLLSKTQACEDWGNTPSVWSCDFEDGGSSMPCNLQQSTSDDLDWSLISGGTPSSNTGPDADHTYNNSTGRYIYIEASSVSPGLAASVSTQPLALTASTSYCLTFWYHMKGDDIGDLVVLTSSPGSSSTVVWTRSKAQGNDWLCGNVTIPSGSQTIIEFRASKGGGSSEEPYGDISLDDVILYTAACASNDSTLPVTTSPAPVPSTTAAATSSPSPASTAASTPALATATTGPVITSCDFDTIDAACGLTQDDDDDLDWTRMSGPSPSQDTGPLADHTSGQGFYMFLEASNVEAGREARLRSPVLGASATTCLGFWYHMYGRHIGNLSVYSNDANVDVLVWQLQRNQSDAWHYAQVTLPANTIQYAIGASKGGVTVSQPFGDIAIDDVTLSMGACVQVTASVPTVGSTTISAIVSTGSASPTTQPTTEPRTAFSTQSSTSTTSLLPSPSTPLPTTTTSTPSTTTTTPPTTNPTTTTTTTTTTNPTTTTTTPPTTNLTTTTTTTTPITTRSSAPPSTTKSSSPFATVSSASRTTGRESTTVSTKTGDVEFLWGIGETTWLIILVVVGLIFVVMSVVVIFQACHIHRVSRSQNASIASRYESFAHSPNGTDRTPPKSTTDYITAYDNVAVDFSENPPVDDSGIMEY